jgi:chitin disaccharide deacetylase
MNKRIALFNLLLIFLCSETSSAQENPTYAERLGWKKGDRVVILHVDDAGMSYESNIGTMNAISKGIATSCSVMMPCGWVPMIVKYLKQNPTVDAGLHLTLTSEWDNYRWVPVAGKSAVPGLTDPEGALWPEVEDVVKHATADEVEKEINAQIDRAKTMGFNPTHLDSHMGTLFATPAFLERYIKAGITNHIPVMIPAGHASLIRSQMPELKSTFAEIEKLGTSIWNAGLPVIDDLHNATSSWPLPADKTDASLEKFGVEKYKEVLNSVKPGLTMVIMHCTASDHHFDQIAGSGNNRKKDMLAMMSPELKKYANEQKIIFTTWKEIMERREKVK